MYPLLLSDFSQTISFLIFSINIQLPNFIIIRPVGTELSDADRQRDVTKVTVAFTQFCERSHKLAVPPTDINFETQTSAEPSAFHSAVPSYKRSCTQFCTRQYSRPLHAAIKGRDFRYVLGRNYQRREAGMTLLVTSLRSGRPIKRRSIRMSLLRPVRAIVVK